MWLQKKIQLCRSSRLVLSHDYKRIKFRVKILSDYYENAKSFRVYFFRILYV